MATDAAAHPAHHPSDHFAVPNESGASPRSAGIAVRRWFLVAAPVLAGLFAVVGAAADPAVGQNGLPLYEAYADNPDPLQLKSFGFHWAYAFWLVPPFLIAALVRRRGVWLANVAALVGFVGISTLPGLLFVDFYDSAIGQVAGPETTVAVNEAMNGMWGVPAIGLGGTVGLVLALPLAAAAAWRGGIVPWWGLAAVVAGQLSFMLSSVNIVSCALTTAFFAVFAFALARGTRPRLA